MGTCAQPVVAKSSHNPLINLRIVYGRQCVWGTFKEILDGAVNFSCISCCPTLGYAIPHLSAHISLNYATSRSATTHTTIIAKPRHVQLRHTSLSSATTPFSYATPHLATPQPT